MSLAGTGASLASEAVAVASLPAASLAVTCRRYVPGKSAPPAAERAAQSTVSAPAAGCGAPCSPTASPSVSTTAQSTVTPAGSAGTSKPSFSVSAALMRSGLTETAADLGRRGVDAHGELATAPPPTARTSTTCSPSLPWSAGAATRALRDSAPGAAVDAPLRRAGLPSGVVKRSTTAAPCQASSAPSTLTAGGGRAPAAVAAGPRQPEMTEPRSGDGDDQDARPRQAPRPGRGDGASARRRSGRAAAVVVRLGQARSRRSPTTS